MMKEYVWVVVEEWVWHGSELGLKSAVFKDYEKAKQYYNERVEINLKEDEDNEYDQHQESHTDDDHSVESWMEGCYMTDHWTVSLRKKELL